MTANLDLDEETMSGEQARGDSSAEQPFRGAPQGGHPDPAVAGALRGDMKRLTRNVQRRNAVRDAFVRAYTAYETHAFGFDELKPLSKRGEDFIGMGVTLVRTPTHAHAHSFCASCRHMALDGECGVKGHEDMRTRGHEVKGPD